MRWTDGEMEKKESHSISPSPNLAIRFAVMLKYLLFDLDETLYPASNGLMPAIGERMRRYIEQTYNLSPEQAHALQKRYWHEFGTTLRGLVLEHHVDPVDYLAYVHDVPVSEYIAPDPRLRQVLEAIPYEKVIVTNADAPHAERVLARLGISDLFTRIFDIVFMEYESKPARGAYERVLRALKVRGNECLLVEDSARNLTAARGLGIRTILVMPPGSNPDVQPTRRFLDPASAEVILECPPDANLCIPDIYHVAEAVRELAAQ